MKEKLETEQETKQNTNNVPKIVVDNQRIAKVVHNESKASIIVQHTNIPKVVK